MRPVEQLSNADIQARLNLDHILVHAKNVADTLERQPYDIVELTPGDMTSYLILVLDHHGIQRIGNRYYVALLNHSQLGYTWDGGHTTPEWVHNHWGAKFTADKWTSVVLSTFLNLLSAEFCPDLEQ